MNTSPQELRKRLRRHRASLSLQQKKYCSQQAVKRLQRSKLFRSARHIALYLPVRGELDPTSLRKFASHYQHFYLPVLSLYKPHGLVFIRWDHKTRFRTNRFNIPEPLIRKSRMIPAYRLDLVVTPLLAFDQQGTRMGMGGGFYDRCFAFKRRQHFHTRPRLAGFAYQFQQVEQLERRPWDIPLDAVFTETQAQIF